jgi:hypothetical protein
MPRVGLAADGSAFTGSSDEGTLLLGSKVPVDASSPDPHGSSDPGPGLPSRQGQGIFTMSCPAYSTPRRLPLTLGLANAVRILQIQSRIERRGIPAVYVAESSCPAEADRQTAVRNYLLA